MDKEKLVQEFCTYLNDYLTVDELYKVRQELFQIVSGYNIQKNSTELVAYDNQIPEELKIFLVSRSIEGLSINTLSIYKLYLENFFMRVNKPLRQISTNDIRIYLYNYQQRNNVKTSSVEQVRICINVFFQWLVNEKYIDINPCINIKPLKCDRPIKDTLTQLELEKIRLAYKNVKEKAIVETLYSTGCRVSELCDMKLSDVDFNSKEIKVYGKGKKERICYINAKCEVALKEYIKVRNTYNTESDSLFLGSRNPHNPHQKCAIEKIIKDIVARTNITKNVTPHTFRRSMATNGLATGLEIQEIQKILGHVEIATTLIYAKVNTENLKAKHKNTII